MISNTENLLFERKLSLTWVVVIVIVLSLFKISICNGEGDIYSSSLLFNDPLNYEELNANLRGKVYPLMDFELPADSEGRIDTIILRNNKKNYILSVIEATSPYVKLVVFLKREEVRAFGEELFGFLKINNIPSNRLSNIILLPLDSKQPFWMRDNGILFVNKKANLITFVPCRSQNEKKVFLKEYMRSSSSDNIVWNDSSFEFNFPGGEIVSSESYMFCKKIKLPDESRTKSGRSDVIKKIEMLCKKKLIDLSTIETPGSHIDLWLTPIDDKTILLGDVLLGKEIMGKIPRSERSKVVSKYIKTERLAGLKLKINKRNKNYKRNIYSMLFNNSRSSTNGISINNVKRYLENRGFTVIVIPSIGQLGTHPDSYYSYNNVLMETYKDNYGRIIKNVIIPEYGHPLDEIARQVWESLGFHVRPFIMNGMARKGGAIRCSSQRVPSTVHYDEEVVEASLH
jgi:hypothetical protein